MADIERVLVGEGMVGIDAEPHLLRNGVAHRGDQADIPLRAHADLHLGAEIAHLGDRRGFLGEGGLEVRLLPQHHAIAIDRHPVTARPAQKTHQRQAGRLARNVPQRDIDRRLGLQRHALLPVIAQRVVDLVPEELPGKRVLAQQQRLNHLFDDRLVAERDIAGTETLADADKALIRLDPDQMAGPAPVPGLTVPHLGHVMAVDPAFDPGDLHGQDLRSCFTMSFSTTVSSAASSIDRA